MSIDTSIYSNIRPIQIPDVMDSMTKAMTLKHLGMQNHALEIEQKKVDRADADDSYVRDAIKRNVGPDGQVDRQSFLSDLARGGLEKQRMGYLESYATADKAERDRKSAELSDKINQASLAANMALSAQDQPSYDRVLQNLKQMGMDTSHMPAQYDPGLMRQYAVMSMDAKTRLDGQKQLLDAQSQQFNQSAKTKELSQKDRELGQKDTELGLNQTKTKAEIQKLGAEADKLQSETYKRNPQANPNDPASLVPSQVPKEHQAKVLEEIKTAEDINALTPKIMAAFQKGSSRNPIVAAQGQREFEGLINTTVKDTEGTARQAAFDSIHKTMTPSGLTATPGENEAKARTVLEYLQSKASAPTARAYGIDLAKFNSTAAYKGAQGGAPDAGGGLVSSANAAEKLPGSTAPHGDTVIQNGFTYRWNPLAGRYE